MSDAINPLDIPGEVFEIEMWNPNPSSSRRKGAPVYRLSFEVPEDVHSAFMNAQQGNLRLVGYMSVLPDTDEQPTHDAMMEKAKKEPKGPYSQLWRHLRIAGFVDSPGVTEAIDNAYTTSGGKPGETRWDTLHAMFGVETLATIGPEQIYEMFPLKECPQVKRMVEQALRKARERETATAASA